MTNTYSASTVLTSWREERDAFFDTYGGPFSPGYRAAKREMPLLKRIFFNANPGAFFFGPLYFFFRGMWKKGIAFLVPLLVLWTLEAVLPIPHQYHIFGMSSCFIQMSCANYAYYLKRVRGAEGWNPFEGMRQPSA